jgi:protein ImuB
MKRIVSVWLPAWPLDRLRRTQASAVPDEVPFALVGPATHGLRLIAVSAAAHAAGLHRGQKLADARAALPALLTAPAAPDADRCALERLAVWCGRYGPARNIDGDDGLWIDVTGVSHLFAGETGLVADLAARLSAAGITARLGLADTFAAAWGLARYGPHVATQPWTIAPPGAAARDAPAARTRLLLDLPVAALRLDAETTLLLRRLGLTRVGQLEAIARTSLARRFETAPGKGRGRGGKSAGSSRPASRSAVAAAHAAAAAVLTRLDELFGRKSEPQRPLIEPPRRAVARTFSEPLISPAGIEAAVTALVSDLAAALDAAHEGARRVCLMLYRVDATTAALTFGTSSASRDPIHLKSLMDERLGDLDLGFGVDMMVLEACEVEPLALAQVALDRAGDADIAERMGRLVDRLANRLGPARVLRQRAQASHIPERAQRLMPVLAGARLSGPVAEPDAVKARKTGAFDGAVPSANLRTAPRPAFLLPRPEPATVLAEVPEGPPVRFTWRRVRRQIVRAEGPERIAPEWWRPFTAAPGTREELVRPRDYYRVEDEHGARYWLFRDGLYGADDEPPPRWFVHGVFP